MGSRFPEFWRVQIARPGRPVVAIKIRPGLLTTVCVVLVMGLGLGVQQVAAHIDHAIDSAPPRTAALGVQAGHLESLEKTVRSLHHAAPSDTTERSGDEQPQEEAPANIGVLLTVAKVRMAKVSRALASKQASARALARQAARPTGRPVAGARLTSRFGERNDPIASGSEFHNGLDFAAPYGTPVQVTARGRVVEAGYARGWGQHVIVDHGYGYQTLYAHLSEITVREGQEVERNMPIGRLGSSGRSTGPHLHYTIYKEGEPVNPEPYLSAPKR